MNLLLVIQKLCCLKYHRQGNTYDHPPLSFVYFYYIGKLNGCQQSDNLFVKSITNFQYVLYTKLVQMQVESVVI
nr:MAG TPA: hypothetical protein [Caudoviricetes sp.]